MTKDHLNLIQRPTRLHELRPESMAELVRRDDTIDPCAAAQRGDHLARAAVTHRTPDLATQQVHEHEVRPRRGRYPIALLAMRRVDTDHDRPWSLGEAWDKIFPICVMATMQEEFRADITRRQAIKKAAQPDDIVGTIGFLTSEDAHFVTGQTLMADGGMAKT